MTAHVTPPKPYRATCHWCLGNKTPFGNPSVPCSFCGGAGTVEVPDHGTIPRIGPAANDGSGLDDDELGFVIAYRFDDDADPDEAEGPIPPALADAAAITRNRLHAGAVATRWMQHAEAVAGLRLRSRMTA